MLALREREKTGRGQCVSGSLLGTALAMSNALTIDHALNGIERQPIGNRAYSSGPTDLFRTRDGWRSEEHTSELQSLMRISYAVFCLKKKKTSTTQSKNTTDNTHYRQRIAT